MTVLGDVGLELPAHRACRSIRTPRGSSRAGRASIERLGGGWENLRLVLLPIHASWLNQIELSIVQRKALSPNSFDLLDELADRLLRFGEHDRQIARPFDWTFTRADPERVLATITEREPRPCACGVTDRDRLAVSRLKGAARGR